MKMRLLSTALGLVLSTAFLTGCGSDSLPIDPNPQLVGLEVRPEELELEMDANSQLFASAVFSNQGRRVVNEVAAWTTSNPAVATISSTGVATGIAPGEVTIFATALGFTASAHIHVPAPEANRLVVSSSETDAVQVLDLEGNVLRSLTNVTNPAQIVFVGNEMYVAAGQEVRVYAWDAAAGAVASRTLTGFGQAAGLAVIGEELFVSDFDRNVIRVFPVTASGDELPTREIATNLAGPGLLAVHEEQLIVANNGGGGVLIFDAEGELQAEYQGPNTGLVAPVGVAAHGDELFVSDGDSIRVFALDGDGDVAPLRVLQSAALNNPAGLTVSGEQLLVANEGNDNLLFFALDAADQDGPLSTFADLAGPVAITAAFAP